MIPLIQADNAPTAVRTARALAAAGMTHLEIVQRTRASLECLAAVAGELPSVVTGAGTVLTPAAAEACIARGARFIVSPGLDEGIVAAARQRGIDVLPGIMTPTELQRAHNLGLGLVKFFPAATAGGVAALKALAAVFPAMRFIPTGGISATNLADYLSLPAVAACAGSWMTPPDTHRGRDYARIEALAAEALAIAAGLRGG